MAQLAIKFGSNFLGVVSAPSAPSALSAVLNVTSAILNWTSSSPIYTGVRVERSTDAINFLTLTTLSASAITYTDTGLLNGTTYTYQVRTIDRVLASLPSNASSVTVSSVLGLDFSDPNNSQYVGVEELFL